MTTVKSVTQQHIEKLAKAITQLGATHTAALIHQLDDIYGIDGQFADLMRKLLEQAECSLRLPGPFLQIAIPEGATHYQDFIGAKDGGMRFYKEELDGETLRLWVWALGRESGGIKWYPVQRLSMANTPLIRLCAETGVTP